MSRPAQLGSRALASMTMLAAAMGAFAPVATVAPSAGGPQTIQAPSTQRTQPSMAQQQTVRIAANQAFMDGGIRGFGFGPSTNIHTFPAWNQRKARKASRQTGRKIQKRYKR